jgi:hypothetical protein
MTTRRQMQRRRPPTKPISTQNQNAQGVSPFEIVEVGSPARGVDRQF